ncbi:tejas isoform X2 [Haematobia irritans]
MDVGFLKQVKVILKSLVLSYPEKITIDQLNRDYRDVEGQDIPYKKLGYRTLEQFLRQIPDTLLVAGTGHSALVFFVENEKSAHIHNMIMGQKKSRPRNRSARSRNKPNLRTSHVYRNHNSDGRNNNKFNAAAMNNQRPNGGQQLSAFDITNRNLSTRKVTVRDIPPVMQNIAQIPIRANGPCLSLPHVNRMPFAGAALPQPNAIQKQMLEMTAKLILAQTSNQKVNNITNFRVNEIKTPSTHPTSNNVVSPSLSKNENNLTSCPVVRVNEIKTPSTHPTSNNMVSPSLSKNQSNLASCPVTRLNEIKTPSTHPTSNNMVSPSLSKNQSNLASCPPQSKEVKSQTCEEVNKKFEEHVRQLQSLMSNSCHISPTPAKTVSFCSEVKNDTKSPKPSDSTDALAGVRPPKPKVNIFQNLENESQDIKKSKPIKDVEDQDNLSANTEMPDRKSLKRITKRAESPANAFKKLMDINEENVDDIDEAVPQFAANSRVFRLDLPKYTVPYGKKIDPCDLPDDIEVGNCIKIFISEIHNPFRFWFHIHKDHHELDALMHNIERFYAALSPNELRIPVVCLNPGQVCAALFNDMWHRGEIVGPASSNKVKVSFVDYGTVCDVDITNIKYLCSCFSQLPAQALRGSLSHIKPRGMHWSHESTQYFLSLVSELMLYAKITEIDRENSVFYMILCDTHDHEVLQINKHLVDKKYALYNEDWQESRFEQNGERIRHPREDFPT